MNWPTPSVAYQSGTGAMNHAFMPPGGGPFRLAYLRVHFGASGSTADLSVCVDSAAGEAFDARLLLFTSRGPGADVNLCVAPDHRLPNGWTFQAGDGLRIAWAGAGSWGVEVGFEEL
jgi:hypothetical protein